MHFPKEGIGLSIDSYSSDEFMHCIKVLMAKNYIELCQKKPGRGKLSVEFKEPLDLLIETVEAAAGRSDGWRGFVEKRGLAALRSRLGWN